MSIEPAKSAILDFLKSNKPSAIALTGSWGRGKTYSWNQAIAEAAKSGQVRKYSYVSLFGIGSIAELRAAIFENAITPNDIANGATADTWRANIESFLSEKSLSSAGSATTTGIKWLWREKRRTVQLLSFAGSWGSALRAASFLAVRDYVICLDDLERKSTNLSIVEIFGLVNQLKEERKSRVVVILNNELFGDAEREQFDGLREKVFDSEIVFAPSPEECARLVFTGNWTYSELASEYSVQLGITNIRVLQRIRRTIDVFAPHLDGKQPSVMAGFIHGAVLLTWCYNGKLTNAPDYQFVKSRGLGDSIRLANPKSDVSPEVESWSKILNKYKFYSTDELDLHVCDFLENGFISDRDELLNAIQRADDAAAKQSADGSFSAAWSLFHNSFSDNEKEFVETLYQRFLSCAKWITFNNAESSVNLIRSLGYVDFAKQMIEHWTKINDQYNPSKLNLSELHFRSDLRDEEFERAVANTFAKYKNEPTLDEAIRRIAGRNGWSRVDESVMSTSSVDEYFKFFKGIDHDDQLDAYVDACLQFGRIINASEQQKAITHNASAALRKIAKESLLNERRVARFALMPEGES